jgi:hypothetical protein
VLIYAGDFDPSGEDIDRDFIQRTACFDEVVRVALSLEQVERYDQPPQLGKATDFPRLGVPRPPRRWEARPRGTSPATSPHGRTVFRLNKAAGVGFEPTNDLRR